MSIRHLPFFLAVAEEEHFKRAAQRLHMTQSALSRRIQDFESEVGAKLFERLPGRARLTEAGRTLRDDARRLLDEYAQALKRAQRVDSGGIGMLRVGFSGVAVRHPRVPRWFDAFRAARPEVELKLVPMVSARQIDALIAGEIDAGFVYAPVEGVAEIASRTVLAHDFVLALPGKHPLAARRTLRLRDLADEPFIWQTRGTGQDRRGAAVQVRRAAAPYERTRARIYDRMLAACQKGGLTPRIVAEVDTAEARLNLVAAGMGICFVDDLQRGSLPDVVLRKVSDLSVPIEMSLVWRRDAASPILAGFVEIVRKTR